MKKIRRMVIPLLLVSVLLLGVVCAAPKIQGIDQTQSPTSQMGSIPLAKSQAVPINPVTQASQTPFVIGMRVTVRPGANYWEGASDYGCGRHGTFSESNIYLSEKATYINGITIVDKDGSPRNTVYLTRDQILPGDNRWSYSLGNAVGQVMVHICVPNFVPGDLGWVSIKDIDPYVNPSSDDGKTPEETKPATTAVPDTTADSGSTDGSNQGHCKWLWLLLPLLLLLALLLWLFCRRRRTLTTAEAVGLITSKNPAAALLDCSGSVSTYSGQIASYAQRLHSIDTFVVFAREAIVTEPSLFQEFSKEVDDSATDLFKALNCLDEKTHYKQVVCVTDGGNNCETLLEVRNNVERVILLTPGNPDEIPRSTLEEIRLRLCDKVIVKQLQD